MAFVLICCGYASLTLGVVFLFHSLPQHTDGRMMLGILVLLGLLSWPTVAGVVALDKLVKGIE